MTYDEWAEEYLKSAKVAMEQIEKYRLKMRSCKNTQLLYFYSKKIATLEGMYDDCMYTARILRLKAAKLRERGLQNLVVV